MLQENPKSKEIFTISIYLLNFIIIFFSSVGGQNLSLFFVLKFQIIVLNYARQNIAREASCSSPSFPVPILWILI